MHPFAVDADAPPPSLFVAMPTYGGIEPGFVESLLMLQRHLARLGIRHHFEFLPGESLITRARNRMVRQFIDERTETHLLFLDCDLMFHPSTVLRLLTSGHEVCAAPYAKKAVGAGLVGNVAVKNARVVDGKEVGEVEQRDGFVKAKDAGTGCLLIARTAFEKLIAAKAPNGETVMVPYTCDLTGKRTFPFFDCGPENARDPTSRYLSEDYFWCRLWQDVGGGEVWLDMHAKIRHVGKYAYEAKSYAEEWGVKA